ncbi:hypothetical protein PUMCH_004897 [Australozyma saopauloensis]|uniref:non-specific serine/threonine protein kinase n=1 Tax=Australozyma saopauloensis TaxID=291208 RepID=A0AAX4HG77_9ASCO|nr:hypothetical protein PUMCH_004897 [[Candida] saopauloensis]
MSRREFVLEKILGKGSFGEVYKARHKKSGNYFAVKVVDIDKISDVHKIFSEVHTLVNIRSQYLNQCYGTFMENTCIWIVLEYCAGGLCHDLLVHFRKIPEDKTCYLIKGVLLGVEYLHEMKIVHRDIKLANILLTEKGHVKLGDFGVSSELSVSEQVCKTMTGTPHWMAPEVIVRESDGYDSKADIWSIGITAYELLKGGPPTARLPSYKAFQRIVNESAPELLGVFSKECKQFVHHCLSRDLASRPSATRLLRSEFIQGCSILPREFATFMNSSKKKPPKISLSIMTGKISGQNKKGDVHWEVTNTKRKETEKNPNDTSDECQLMLDACDRLGSRARNDIARQFLFELRKMFINCELQNTNFCAEFYKDLNHIQAEFKNQGKLRCE